VGVGLYGETVDTTSPTFARLTDDARILQQAIELCLQTRRGSLWSAPDYGRSLRAWLLVGLRPDQVAALPQDIASGLEQDERIAHATVRVTSVAARSIVLAITVYARGSAGTPYAFVATVTPDLVQVQLRGLG
jgi:hypothetical protein